MDRQHSQSGFTLFELVLYIGMAGLVIGAMVTFSWRIIGDSVKVQRLIEVQEQGVFTLRTLGEVVPSSSTINASTTFGGNPDDLVLDQPDGGTITIDTVDEVVNIGGQSTTVTRLRYTKSGSPAVYLTGERLDVTTFTLTDRSNASAESITVDLKVEAVNNSGSPVYNATKSWSTTLTLR